MLVAQGFVSAQTYCQVA